MGRFNDTLKEAYRCPVLSREIDNMLSNNGWELDYPFDRHDEYSPKILGWNKVVFSSDGSKIIHLTINDAGLFYTIEDIGGKAGEQGWRTIYKYGKDKNNYSSINFIRFMDNIFEELKI